MLLADRLSNEYRQQLTGTINGAVVPCPGVDFKAFISQEFHGGSYGTLDIINTSSGLAPVRAPAGTTTFPVNFQVYNRVAVIDRWRPDPSHPAEAIQIANIGDITATQEVWVIGDDHAPIARQSAILSYSITYRASDMRIISLAMPCWYYFAAAGSEEVDPMQHVSGFHRDAPEAPLSRDIEGYTVADETGFAYLVASRTPTAQALDLAPDAALRQRAASISQVAIPIQVHNWRSLQWHPLVKPSIYTEGLIPVLGGIWGVISPYLNYPNGEEMIIQGYTANSPLTITTTIQIPDDRIKLWWDKTQDCTWSSECWLNYYLLGSVTTDPCPIGCLVIKPERIVATSFERIYFYNMGVLDPNGGHPIVSASNNEEIVADYDPQIAQNLARFQNGQRLPKPVSTIKWFPR